MARRKRREGHSLHKVLGVGALFSTAYGNVGSSIYYALGVVAVAALGLTPAVFVITGVLFIATAWSYSEATAAMPEAGGASSFTRRAFNEFASFGIGWAQMLTYTATIAISALFVPQYLSIFWPILKEPPYNVIGGAITILILVVLNVVGIKEAASLNVVLALLDLGTQILIMIIALVLLLEPNLLISQIHWGIAPTWSQFLYGLAMGTVAYTGIETISNMAEEAEQPAKDVPRSINFVIIAVLVVYIGMPLAALSSMNVDYNTVPVDPATGLTVPVAVVPGEPEGTYRLESDPSVVVYVPLEEQADGTMIIPPQKPSGEVETVDGQQVTKLYGTQLGSNFLADPVLGMVRFCRTTSPGCAGSFYYALSVVAVAALGLTPAVFVITGVLFIATAWSYSEATAAMPEAGGASSFTRRAFNEFASFGIGWAQMLTYTATIAISALFVPQYLSIFWPILKEPPYNVIGGALTILILVVINVVGIKEAASLNVVLALLDLGTQILIMIIALVLLLEPNLLLSQIHWGVAPTWSQFLYGLAMGTVAYTGIETISNMAEEAHHPDKDVPRSINFVIIAVLVVYIGMPLAALSSMNVDYNTVPVDPATGLTVPVRGRPRRARGHLQPQVRPQRGRLRPARDAGGRDRRHPASRSRPASSRRSTAQQVTKLYGTQLGSNYLSDPVLGMVRFLPDNVAWLRWILGPWVGILAATILFIATNAGIIGVSRLAFSLGQHRQLPRVLGRVHPTRLTPYVAIILFGIVAVILILPGEIPLLADLYAFGSMIAFTAAHVSVIMLRYKEPELARPFRAPLNVRIGGTRVPHDRGAGRAWAPSRCGA